MPRQIRTAAEKRFDRDAIFQWVVGIMTAATDELENIAVAVDDIDTSENPADGTEMRALLQERIGQIETVVDWCIAKITALRPPKVQARQPQKEEV